MELKKTRKVVEDELELVYIIRQEHRGRGYGSQAINWLVSEQNKTIVAYVNPKNQFSKKILLKNGFRREGLDEKYVLPHVNTPDSVNVGQI